MTLTARREKWARRRRLGWWGVGLGVLAAFVAVFILLLEVTFLGASTTGFTACGAAIAPVSWPAGPLADLCAQELGIYRLVGGAIAVVAAALIAVGIVFLARTPRTL